MEYFSIGSGSSGNCACICTANTKILLDAGLSGKKTVAGLNACDCDISEIEGIFITHEHRDHIQGLGVLSRRYGIPVYATGPTIKGILESGLGEIERSLLNEITPEKSVVIGDLSVNPFSIKHDAKDPVAYSFLCDGRRLSIVTDLGCYDENIIRHLSESHAIVIESNHDINMLQTGIYPYQLKRRVASDYGHLSNEDCGKLLSKVLHDDLEWIVLAHLSAENNYDRLAKESVGLEISMAPNKYRAGDFPIDIAPRSVNGPVKKV